MPSELVIFKFFLFELVRYSADRDVVSDWTKNDLVCQLLTLLRVFLVSLVILLLTNDKIIETS